jgi:Fe2+ transport system protein FeoA
MVLSALPLGRAARILKVEGPPQDVAWLTALGLGPDDELTVVRRGALGGPLQVRTRAGGEFALDRALAHGIHVEPVEATP